MCIRDRSRSLLTTAVRAFSRKSLTCSRTAVCPFAEALRLPIRFSCASMASTIWFRCFGASAVPVDHSAAAAEWSTGTALDPKQRNQMVLAIDAQEKRMGNLSASAKGQTAVLLQVKLFLEKARTAVVSNDLD